MKAITFMVLLLSFVALCANLVENKPTDFTQPDGTTLSLYVSGDEYYHRVHDERGYTILQNPETGYAVYAVPDGNSIKPSDFVVGTVDPATLGISPNLFKQDASIEQRYTEQQRLRTSGNRADPTGTVNNIVVFVRFSDQTEFPTSTTYSWYYNLFNSTTQQSLADFYDEVSSGQLDINTYLYSSSGSYILSVQASNPRGYYSPYNISTNPIGYQNDTEANNRQWGLFSELIAMTDPLVPAGIDVDMDDDANIDALTFIIRGATDDWGDILWPAHVSWGGSLGTINGTPVWHYVRDFEGGLGSSVVCHEMGHMIGFPDLYHYTGNGITPVGGWSLMASDNTQHELAYEKYKYGTWFSTIPTITATSTPTVYTLSSIENSTYACYKIASNLTNAFYMVEYRGDVGRYESGVPGAGLVVYRVQETFAGSNIDGNAGGPPDELYVYRPGGDMDTNGTVNSAGFSSTVSRTKIHTGADPEPWLLGTTGQTAGNLVITDVTATGGTSISFTLRDSAPNIWDGSTSTEWSTPANWSLNHVPTISEDVEVPGSLARYPICGTTQSCRSLLVKSGANCSVSVGTLTVATDFKNFGIFNMSEASGNLYVQRDLFFESGSTVNMLAAAEIFVQSDIDFLAGSTVNMNNGTIIFYGTGHSYIRNYAATAIYGLKSDKDNTYYCGISAASSTDLTVNGSIYINDGSEFNDFYSGMIILKGGIYSYTGGLCALNSGTINMQGNTSSFLYLTDAGNYLNNLIINKGSAYNVTLSFPLTVKGNLAITTGTLNSASKTITVGGNWTNSAGIVYYTEGTGTVIFNGSGAQYLSSETFSVMQLNKTAGILYINSGVTVTCASYDWVAGAYTVAGGTFTVADLADGGVYGTITLTSGAINYTQDAAQYIDLGGTITINGGAFNIYGGNGSCWFSYGTPTILTMTNGILDIKNQGIYLSTSYSVTENISGGTIRTTGSFLCYRTDFTPIGGTVELYGTTDWSINCAAGSNLYNLNINKTASTRDEEPLLSQPETRRERDGSEYTITRSNTILAASNILITNTLTITSGVFDINGFAVTVYNDLLNYASLKMILNGTVDVGDDFNWYSTSTANVTVGTCYCGGNWYFASGTAISLTGSTTVIDNAYGGSLTNYSSVSQFGNLNIYGTEEDPVTTYNYTGSNALRVTGNLTIYGTNTLNLNEGVCTVTGNTYIHETGVISVGDGGSLTITGGLDLQGSLITGPGMCTVHGFFNTYTNGSLSVVGGEFANDAAWNTGGGNVISLNGAVTINGGSFEITDKTLSIQAHATRVFTNATLTVGVGFSANMLNCYHPTGGALYLIGANNPTLDISNGNWASNLFIYKTSSSYMVYQQTPLTVTGTFSIIGGKYYTNNFNMSVGGNWTNNIGTAAFLPGTGTVTFNQAGGLQTIAGANNFYNVTDSHTGAALDFTGNTGISGTLTVNNIVTMQAGASMGAVVNSISTGVLAFYNNYLFYMANYTGGGALRSYTNSYVTVAELTQNGLYGSFIIDTGHIEFHQDASNWIDLNGNMTISNNGIVDIYGGSLDCYMAYSGNTVLTMSSGEFNIKNHGFYIYNNGFTGNFIISGGTMHLAGGWTDNWGIFDPTGGIVEMTGSADNTISAHASSWFWTLKVNKPLARTDGEPEFATDREGRTTPITRNGSLSIGACTIKGGLTIQMANQVNLNGNISVINAYNVTVTAGTLALNAYTLTTTGHINVSGTLLLGTSSNLKLANAKDLNINSGGSLLSVGTSVLPAMITHNVSGYYGLNIENGGTIAANYTIFEYMNANGVYLKTGSLVDLDYSLDNCTFRLGTSSGRLLMINNSQSFTVDGAVFPTNTWSGAYNVTKSLNSGIVYFDNWTGAFGGPTYEQDSYNHLYWEGFGIPPVIDLNISYVSATSRILLSWTYPLTVSYYKIYRSTTPYGTYSYLTSTLSNSWSQAVPGPKYYYKVTAVTP